MKGKMYKLYYLISESTDSYYIGITSGSLARRFAAHKRAAKIGKKTPLYSAMRKYEDFNIILVAECPSLEDVCDLERTEIKLAREANKRIYNLADGGQVGYSMSKDIRYSEWKSNLSKARQGKKPALGMKHTEENKKFFSECSKRRTLVYPDLDVTKYSFKEANEQFGISKTHYYRLLKRAKSNELS